MSLLFTMRTADRSPKRNYLRETVRILNWHGVDAADIHVFPTDPDVAWIPPCDATVYWPERQYRANENAIRMIGLLDTIDADWIVLSEDDLEWCPDPIGSMSRWLDRFHHPDVSIYRFFAFDQMTRGGCKHAKWIPLREMRGSQAVAMRAADARRFAAWAKAHPLDWRPKGAPFQDRPHDGFDKLLGYWALQDRPSMTDGLVSRPFFVKHLGVQSSLHRVGVRKDAEFIGAQAWP